MNWSQIFVAYDNMCHLDGLRAAKNLLPWPSPWDKAWISVNKIIDSLHMRNHKDKECKQKYDPSHLKEDMPNANTMAAEQTFVWLSRFKNIYFHGNLTLKMQQALLICRIKFSRFGHKIF